MEISRANLRGTCFSPHLKTFSDSLVTTKRNPKLPSMVLKTLGPSLQPCPQPLQSQGMAHRSPKTCKLFQILSFPPTPSSLVDSSSSFKHHVLQEGFYELVRPRRPSGCTLRVFCRDPLYKQTLSCCSDPTTCWPPPGSPIMKQIFFKHLLCAKHIVLGTL